MDFLCLKLTYELNSFVTSLTTHKNTPNICAYKPHTQKKNEKKVKNTIFKKLCVMYIDSKNWVQKKQKKNIAIIFQKKHSYII